MDIIIQDTGIPKSDYTSSFYTNRYNTLNNSAQNSINAGRFRVDGQLRLKLQTVNYGSGSNDVDIPNVGNIKSSKTSITKNPIKLSMTAELIVPTSFKNTSELKDVEDMMRIALLDRTRGHKDLYVIDGGDSNREALTHLYQLTRIFGHNDPVGFEGNSDNYRHLNITIDSISANGGIGKIVYNVNCTILIDNITGVSGL